MAMNDKRPNPCAKWFKFNKGEQSVKCGLYVCLKGLN